MNYNIDTSLAVFISAAGKGTRLKELTKETPKPLIDINGRPLIDYLITFLLKHLANSKVYVVYGYQNKKWVEYIDSYKNRVVNFILEPNPINLINSFLKATKSIKEEIILVVSGDMVFDFSIVLEAIRQHVNSNTDITVAINKSSENNYKCWDYLLDGDEIIDVVRDSKPTNIERYFFIVNRKAILDYTSGFTINMADTLDEFKQYQEYNQGWSCLTKKLIDTQKFKIRALYFDKHVINVNNLENLMEAQNFYSNLHI